MEDVNTGSLHSDIVNGSADKWVAWGSDPVPTNLSRASGHPNALQLFRKDEYDDIGRHTWETAPGGKRHYTRYDTDRTMRFPYVETDSGSASYDKPKLPVLVAVFDNTGANTEVVEADPATATTASGVPTGISAGQGNYVGWTKKVFDTFTGELTEIQRFHNIPSSGTLTEGTHYYGQRFLYDTLGRWGASVQFVESGKYQVIAFLHDVWGRMTEVRSGVATAAPTGYSALDEVPINTPTNFNGFATVATTEYDSNGVGDDEVTRTKRFYDTGSNNYVETIYKRTFRGHLRGIERNNGGGTPFSPFVVYDVDWFGRPKAQAFYTSFSDWSTVTQDDGYDDYLLAHSSYRNFWTKVGYDSLGRVFRVERYPGTETTNHFEANNYFDRNGRLVCTGDKYSAHIEYAYDGAGRRYQTRVVTDVASPKYASGKFSYRAPAPNPSLSTMITAGNGDDGLIQFVHNAFDLAGNAIEEHAFEINHADTNGIDIDSTSSYVRQTLFAWYDPVDRLKTVANYGSGDGTSASGNWKYTEITSGPSELDWTDSKVSDGYVHLAKVTYNPVSGQQETITAGVRKNGSNTKTVATKVFFDDLGRRTFAVENHQDTYDPTAGIGTVTAGQNRTTGVIYNGLSRATTLTAYNSGSPTNQTTKYFYEDLYNTSLTTNAIYPDSLDSDSSGTDQTALEYHLDGRLKKRKTQGENESSRTIHEYTYDSRRQLELDKVTQLGTGIDSAIQSIKRTYDSLGRSEFVTSYSGISDTSTVQNEIQYAFDARGKLEYMYQSHQEAVNTGTTPKLQITYETGVTSNIYNNGLRVQNTHYPAAAGAYNFSAYAGTNSIPDRLNRSYIEKLFGGTALNGNQSRESLYWYNGLARLAAVSGGGRRLIYISDWSSGEYDRFDRFGRNKSQVWDDGGSPATIYDQVDYTYDYAGNRLSRDARVDLINGSYPDTRDQKYIYDDLHRMLNYDQGTLVSGSITSSNLQRYWELDQLGNWPKLRQGLTGTSTVLEERAHNAANELTSFTSPSNYVDPALDLAGNMTTMPQPASPTATFSLKYDAWNRLVEVKDGNNLVQTNEYDGLGERIVRVDAVPTTDVTYNYYYNHKWQLLTEVKDATVEAIYQWHPYYVDALNLRMRASDMHWFAHDANFNVTAAISDSSDTVVERYAYTPYGEVTFLNAGFTPLSNQASAIGNHHLYTGRERDQETGLQLNRLRYYASHLGRWVNRDPFGYWGGPNLYGYVDDRPSYYLDPTGEFWHIIGGAIAGAILGGVIGAIQGGTEGALEGMIGGAVGGAVAAATLGAGLVVGAAITSSPTGVGIIGGAISGGLGGAAGAAATGKDPIKGAAAGALTGGIVTGIIGGAVGAAGGAADEVIEGCADPITDALIGGVIEEGVQIITD